MRTPPASSSPSPCRAAPRKAGGEQQQPSLALAVVPGKRKAAGKARRMVAKVVGPPCRLGMRVIGAPCKKGWYTLRRRLRY